MKFRTTRKEYSLRDASGYAFDVVLVRDGEYGWGASVSFSSHGAIHEYGALDMLQRSISEFMRMVKDVEP